MNFVIFLFWLFLEKVHRKDGIVISEQLSEITKRWGRNPQGTAGYFSRDNPSLRGIAGGKRALTERGLEIVIENRQLGCFHKHVL